MVDLDRCPCGEKARVDCDYEWGPGCDLGNNPAYARRAPDDISLAVDKSLGIVRAPLEADIDPSDREAIADVFREIYGPGPVTQGSPEGDTFC